MGFETECIKDLQSLNEDYLCPICRFLVYPDEALMTQCGHLYCSTCLSYLAQTTKICPRDGMFVSEFESKPLLEADRVLADTIWKISVHCMYYTSGCTWEGTLKECLSHSLGCSFGNCRVTCNPCGMQARHQLASPSQLPQQLNQTSESSSSVPSQNSFIHLQQLNQASHQHVSPTQTYLENPLVGPDVEILLDYGAANHNQLGYCQLSAGIQSLPQHYGQTPLSYPPLAHPQPVHSQGAFYAPSYAEQQPGPQAVPHQAIQMAQYYQPSNVFTPQVQPTMQNLPEPYPNPIIQAQSSQLPQGLAQVPISSETFLAHSPSLNSPSGLVPPNNLYGNVSGLGNVTPVARGQVSIGLAQSPLSQVMMPFPPAPPLQVPVERPPPRLNAGMTRGISFESHDPSNLVHGRNMLPVENFKSQHDLVFGGTSHFSEDGMNINPSPLEALTHRFGSSSSKSMPGQAREDSLTNKRPFLTYADIRQAGFELFPGGDTGANKSHSVEEESRGINIPSDPNAIQRGVHPSDFRSGEISGHLSRGKKPSVPDNSQSHLQYNVPAFTNNNRIGSKSGNLSQQRAPERGIHPQKVEVDPSNRNTRKRPATITTCNACNVIVENFHTHSQTEQHREALDIFMRQQKNPKKPKLSSNHSRLDRGHHPRKGNPDDRGNNGNAPKV